MSLKFKIQNENEVVEGNDYKQVAEAIRSGSRFAAEEDLATYMKGFAERYEVQTGKKIAYNNASNFVKSLVKVGYLIEQ
jgi:hypothetical protein